MEDHTFVFQSRNRCSLSDMKHMYGNRDTSCAIQLGLLILRTTTPNHPQSERLKISYNDVAVGPTDISYRFFLTRKPHLQLTCCSA